MALRATLAVTLVLAAACGDDGGGDVIDADTTDPADAAPAGDAMACAGDLAPTADGSGIAADLVLSEIDPGNFIELYNNTDSPISLGSVAHQLCSPFAYRALSAEAPNVTVPPRGLALIPWPSNFTDTDAGGEVILYKSASFATDTDIIDFVCWGTNPHGSRKSQAENAGKWSGGCAMPLPTGGSIERIEATTGTGLTSYRRPDTPTPTNCE